MTRSPDTAAMSTSKISGANTSVETADDFAACFDVSRETMARLSAFQALLGKWQKAVNLVGPSTLQQFWSRHAADSAQLLRYAPPSAKVWLDMGSGAGFPALVMAIMLAEQNPEACVHMVESDRKKVNFLRTVTRECGLNSQIHHMRIEQLTAKRPPALADIDVITARALAALPQLVDFMAPFFNSSTIALLHKGRDWQEELTACAQYWTMQSEVHASMTDTAARLIEISQLAAKAE